jgi:hypothetical protein
VSVPSNPECGLRAEEITLFASAKQINKEGGLLHTAGRAAWKSADVSRDGFSDPQ